MTSRLSPARLTVAFAVAATVSVSLPVFLVGALIVQVREELAVPLWGLGLIVAVFWGAAAVAASAAGALDERLGSRRLTILSLVTAAIGLSGFAAVTPGWGWFIVWAAVTGLANGVQHPATNALITAQVALERRGLAFGLKQAAVPAATVLSGFAIPLVALTFGWRWAFAAAAAIALVSVVTYALTGAGSTVPRRRRQDAPQMPLDMLRFFRLLAIVAFTGGAVVTACSAYIVTGASDRGIDPAVAGLLLAAASIVGALWRGIMGAAADRHRDRSIGFSAGLIVIGGLGALAIAIPTLPTFFAGTLLVVGFAGAWAGLVHYFVSRTAGPMTSRATGMTQTGSFIGCAVGPIVFGTVYGLEPLWAPWVLAGLVALCGGVLGLMLARKPPLRWDQR